jgi:hypothetical protein
MNLGNLRDFTEFVPASVAAVTRFRFVEIKM